jgi:leucyl aminopeptidase
VLALVEQARRFGEFKGAKNDLLTFHNRMELNARRTIFVGVGKREKLTPENFRVAAGKCVGAATAGKCENIAFVVPVTLDVFSPLEILRAMMEGAYLANFKFEYYKGEKKHAPVSEIRFFLEERPGAEIERLIERTEAVCASVVKAREWVGTPSCDKVPARMAEYIADRAGKAGLAVRVFTEKELSEKGFGAVMAVGAGAVNPPRMLVLEYNGEGAEKTVALIGKGVTFDSGGMNLKPGKSLATMKSDMAGAAAVACAMIALARLKPAIDIVGIIPVVENMLSGSATRTGDVIRTYSGKTVEIGNTDAEGRLILADAISYALKMFAPDAVVDLATLTGACVTALGEGIAGVFSNDDELAVKIVRAGDAVHEPCWRLPLAEQYREKLDSDIADINNIGKNPAAGAIVGALFLAEFVEDVPFAHIDIAGPSFIKKKNAYCGPGGTGFGVRLLCELLERF